jgi:hypothetical protein
MPLLIVAFIGYGLLQIYVAFLGISAAWGSGWAIGIMIAVFLLRLGFPITIGAFYGALVVWDWHWIFALLFAAPGLLVAVPSLAINTWGALKRA